MHFQNNYFQTLYLEGIEKAAFMPNSQIFFQSEKIIVASETVRKKEFKKKSLKYTYTQIKSTNMPK